MTGSDAPTLLLPHQVSDDAAAELRTAVEGVVPDADIRRTTTPPETEQAIEVAEAVATFALPRDLLDRTSDLRWVQALSAGVDGYDLGELEERGIALTNASGVHAEPIAEQVLGYMLTFERGIHRGIRQQSQGVWEAYGGGELRGKTLGVVGVGAIGSRVAELGSALGMTVLGTKRTPENAPGAVDEMFGTDGLYEVLDRAEYVVVACPLTDESRGLIGSAELGTMDGDAVLVNIGRGEIVDEAALVHALQERHIRGAGLDVFEEEPLPAESPLWDLSNVVVTPHMAGSTPAYHERCAEILAENYLTMVEEGPEGLTNRVL